MAKSMDVSQLETETMEDETEMMEEVNGAEFQRELLPAEAGIGILMRDGMSQRLVEAASVHLDLLPVALDMELLDSHGLSKLEMIVVDSAMVPKIRSLMRHREENAEGINPALVVVHDRRHSANAASAPLASRGAHDGLVDEKVREDTRDASDESSSEYYDGELHLPLEPAALVAQLSLILYAHRAFARRYHSALEELHLNRRIFRSVTSGISVANARVADMPLVYVNPAFEVMTGYSLEEVQGLNCRFLQRGDNDQPGLTLVRQAIREQREVTVVVKNYRKDGTAFWNELSLSPIRNRDGELTHFVGIQTDVTARVEFEAALRESEKLAAVGRLASSIAHEINNPLESVMNLIYLAQRTDERVEMQRFLSLADKELQRVSLIAAQSLRFYKQSSKPQLTHATDLLASVIDLYQGRMESAGVTVERRDRATLPIVCLESEIRQVLNNLIRNAVDAMRETGGRLLVRSRNAVNLQDGMDGVTVTIADTGSGISRETMKQLFTPFFTTKGIRGTGLGLWISSEIIERHHGRLAVRSSQREGCKGTIFQLFLPSEGLTPLDAPGD